MKVIHSREKSETVAKIIQKIPERINFGEDTMKYEVNVFSAILSVHAPNEAIDRIMKSLFTQNIFFEEDILNIFSVFFCNPVEILQFSSKKFLSFVKASKHFFEDSQISNLKRYELKWMANNYYHKLRSRHASQMALADIVTIMKIWNIQPDKNLPATDGVDGSFMQVVDEIGKIGQFSAFVTKNVKCEARYFFEMALIDSIRYGACWSYVSGLACLKMTGQSHFVQEIVNLCEARLLRKQTRKSNEKYPPEEELMVGRFYAEFFFQSVVPILRGQQMFEILQKKEKAEGFDGGSSDFIQHALAGRNKYNGPK